MSGKMATVLWGVRCLTTAIGLWERQTGLGKLPMEPNEMKSKRKGEKKKEKRREKAFTTSRAIEIMSFTSKG